MKKKALCTLMAVVMAAGIAAAASAEENVTLTVLAGQGTTDAGIEDMIDEALAEKYPYITRTAGHSGSDRRGISCSRS